MISPYIQIAKENLSSTESNVWQTMFEDTKTALKSMENKYVKNVFGKFQGFCPWSQFITIDALNTEDWPNGIAQNSVYVQFAIDFATKKVEIHSTGHIWISDRDKEIYPQYKYLAMHSMLRIAKERKVKGIRKSSFKNAEDLAKKMMLTFTNIMNEVNDYTEGYPYKKGVKTIR